MNVGFSGGEKKRNDILQMAVLEPELCILDESDSGLDIDALKIVSQGVLFLTAGEANVHRAGQEIFRHLQQLDLFFH